ncbi:DUF554 domain-containing protein [Neisseria perflava]|uniref:DUF554 domain-containing protein n=1 Tax=Neisseria perflava TaxID=33053 RepID=UPI00209F0EA9|nr:DUF554 domain-containing protein [Neisseria perflava]MCP1661104.1 putative membrane protein YqgA involved in biofilm formation [Neisseria perflava]MCP1771475.1 putative membrane protein YqgA involved in biofilm formation [Neisseria perflava]
MNFPVGPLVNAAAIIGGALCGATLGAKLPERVRANLPTLFGLLSTGLGVMAVPKVQYYAAVSLSAVIGTALGEWFNIEKGISTTVTATRSYAEKLLPTKGDMSAEKFVENYVSLVVLFCVSGMGIFGAMQEGMTGDPSILYIKSILDVFTAMIFAIGLGMMVAFIAIPQTLLQLILFFLAALIVPLTTPAMRADFTALGGLMMLMTGFRIMGIKSFPVANMLPGLLLVMPISHFWAEFIAH